MRTFKDIIYDEVNKSNPYDILSDSSFGINAISRVSWSYDQIQFRNYGEQGISLAKSNLSKLIYAAKKENIQVTLVVYPWPEHFKYDEKQGLHKEKWKEFASDNDINFLDLWSPYFDLTSEEISKIFIENDVHWNEYGHHRFFQYLINAIESEKIMLN
jgi:hypothetical protein